MDGLAGVRGRKRLSVRARLFVVLALAACKSSPVVTLASAEPAAVEQQPLECKSPRFDPTATCAETLKTFYVDMADACAEAQPSLADAMRAVSRDVLIRPLPVGPAGSPTGWQTRDRKSFTLYQASWEALPRACTTDFRASSFAGDDYGRDVEQVTRLWKNDPRCRPDETVFAARGDAQGTIDIGVWSFATVLAPHLTPAGKAYLRKLLVCEERGR